jgi:hypothetical protein
MGRSWPSQSTLRHCTYSEAMSPLDVYSDTNEVVFNSVNDVDTNMMKVLVFSHRSLYTNYSIPSVSKKEQEIVYLELG